MCPWRTWRMPRTGYEVCFCVFMTWRRKKILLYECLSISNLWDLTMDLALLA